MKEENIKFSYQNAASLNITLNRQNYGPLDKSTVFRSLADLEYYRSGGSLCAIAMTYNEKPYPYAGQIVSLVDNDACEVKVYKLVPNYALSVFDKVQLDRYEIQVGEKDSPSSSELTNGNVYLKLIDGMQNVLTQYNLSGTGILSVESDISGNIRFATPGYSAISTNLNLGQLSVSHYPVSSMEQLNRLSAAHALRNGDTAVVVSGIAGSAKSYTAFVYDLSVSAWMAMDGNYSADNVYFSNDITCAGNYTQIGNVTKDLLETKTLSAAGKSVKDVFQSIFTKEIKPEPVAPTASFIGPSNWGSKEVGDWVTGVPAYTFKYVSDGYFTAYNDGLSAGNKAILSTIHLTRTALKTEDFSGNVYHISAVNGNFQGTGDDLLYVGDTRSITATSSSELSVQVTDSEQSLVSYSGSASYAKGTAVPKTNISIACEDKMVPAGSWSSSVTIKVPAGYRYRFWYVGTDMTTEISAEYIRSFRFGSPVGASTASGDTSSTTITKSLAIPAGTKRIVLAVRGTGKTLMEVKDVDGMGLDVKGNFIVQDMNIPGLNGFSPIGYTVFICENAAGLKATTYEIK